MVTYPAEHVAAGLGDTPGSERPLEATLYGTRIRWRDGDWRVSPEREVAFRHNPGKGGINGRRAGAAG